MLFGGRPLFAKPPPPKLVWVMVYFQDPSNGRQVLIRKFQVLSGVSVAAALLRPGGFVLTGDRRNAQFVTRISYGRTFLAGNGIKIPGPEVFFWMNGVQLEQGIYAATIPLGGATILVGLVRPKGE